jgi:hypothetical protein
MRKGTKSTKKPRQHAPMLPRMVRNASSEVAHSAHYVSLFDIFTKAMPPPPKARKYPRLEEVKFPKTWGQMRLRKPKRK